MINASKHFDAIIIGAGPIGILSYKVLKNLGLKVCIIVENEETSYKTKNSSFKLNKYEEKAGLFGKMPLWGNGHDTDFKNFMKPPLTSDFPETQFSEIELFEAAKKLQSLGWPGIKNTHKFKSRLTKALIKNNFESSEVQVGKLFGIIDKDLDYKDVVYVKSGIFRFLVEGGKKSKIQAITFGDGVSITANNFLLCAGGLGNLALLNKIFSEIEPSPISKILGHGFSNHPKQITHTLFFTKLKYFGLFHMIGKKWKSLEVLDFVPNENFVGNNRNLRISIRFRPAVSDSRGTSGKKSDFYYSIFYRFAVKLGWLSCVRVMTYFEMPQKKSNIVKVNFQESNVVELDIDHRFSSVEKEYIKISIDKITNIFEEESIISRVIEHEIDFDDLEQNDASHYFGTTRMHDDPLYCVVDVNSLVHGSENLYCCGTSVLPLSAPNHPTWFAAILAVKACESIALKQYSVIK